MYMSLNTSMLGIGALPFEGALALARRHGFGAVGYSMAALAEQGIDAPHAQDLMGRYGVIVSDFGLPVEIVSDQRYAETLPALEASARLAQQLGVARCYQWLPCCSDELPYERNYQRFLKMLTPVAETLAAHGIRLGLEFIGPKTAWSSMKYPFIHTLESLMELARAIPSRNVGVLLDAHHCYTSGLPGDAFAPLIQSESDIVMVHLCDDRTGVDPDELKDAPRFYPGEPGGGETDLRAFLLALQRLGYTGPVVAEPFSEALRQIADPDRADKVVATIAASSKSVWPD